MHCTVLATKYHLYKSNTTWPQCVPPPLFQVYEDLNTLLWSAEGSSPFPHTDNQEWKATRKIHCWRHQDHQHAWKRCVGFTFTVDCSVLCLWSSLCSFVWSGSWSYSGYVPQGLWVWVPSQLQILILFFFKNWTAYLFIFFNLELAIILLHFRLTRIWKCPIAALPSESINCL